MTLNTKKSSKELTFEEFKAQVLIDYRLVFASRSMSLIGRKEVLNGRAKFGIFGDGKELAQIALSKMFQNGDWRSGYYRDQTIMLATGMLGFEEFFAQLYGDNTLENNRVSNGRMMNNHFGTRFESSDVHTNNFVDAPNTSADVSCTAGQMPRLLGLAQASKMFRDNKDLHKYTNLSHNGTEVAFGTIGDASTSEGHFWEVINAAGILQVPMTVSVWDDGFGISVPTKLQTTKASVSDVLKGFEKEEGTNGIKIFKVKGWDYPQLCKTYEEAVTLCREEYIPVLVHVVELAQPTGHSSSGSHERYKSKERIEWEKEYDCNQKFKEWIFESAIASEEELDAIEKDAMKEVLQAKKAAYKKHKAKFEKYRSELVALYSTHKCGCDNQTTKHIDYLIEGLRVKRDPVKHEILGIAKRTLRFVCPSCGNLKFRKKLSVWIKEKQTENNEFYSSHLYCEGDAERMVEIAPEYSENGQTKNGSEVLRDNFDAIFTHQERVLTFGEDTGMLGDVNQGLHGLQEKHGKLRIFDTGIREASIVGQGVGMALRGLRPIAEVQYLDYVLYALQTLSDDLASTSWRTAGGQNAPLIIRTRGHRLEGVWHSGSPMSMLLNALRGLYICVPRNMTQAAGMYNQLLKLNSPALVIETLNAYRLKEKLPLNPGEYTVPLGKPEVLVEGADVTIVTYGACVQIAIDSVIALEEFGISVEIIDVQTLLPFDTHHLILESIKKTGKALFFDEDVPGGASAYMMQQVVEGQNAYDYLDVKPQTLSAYAHRPAYHSDGDYFSNPNWEDLFERVYGIMRESNPGRFPELYAE